MCRAANVSRIAGKLFLGLQIALFYTGCSQSGGPEAPETEADGAGVATTGPKAADMDNLHPVVQIRTSLGELTVELDGENTPIAVDNFLAYVGENFYDGLIFHQVDAGYMALAGGYDAQLKPREPRFPVRNEAHKSAKNTRGTLAMARDPSEIDSVTSQFFINLADNTNLDHQNRDDPAAYGYCVFGKVTEGQDVLDKISAVSVAERDGMPNVPEPAVVIESIRRVR